MQRAKEMGRTAGVCEGRVAEEAGIRSINNFEEGSCTSARMRKEIETCRLWYLGRHTRSHRQTSARMREEIETDFKALRTMNPQQIGSDFRSYEEGN